MTLASTVVMVEPRDFGFNADTAVDNAFQHTPDSSAADVQKLALSEFWQMVEHLDKHHLDIIPLSSPDGVDVPDAVFPNNWFSTNANELIIYPMKAANRQLEVQPEALVTKLVSKGILEPKIVDLRASEDFSGILEGTGVLIFDYQHQAIYANLSERCEMAPLKAFCERYDLALNTLRAVTDQCVPIYHTNVLMAIGEQFAVIAEPTLTSDAYNQASMSQLRDAKQDVIIISEQQMVESFCGNIIHLQ